jgi:hypothetical protein
MHSQENETLQKMDFQPITLLNTDYKILALIITGRLRPALEELLYPNP